MSDDPTILGHTALIAHLASSTDTPRGTVRDIFHCLAETVQYQLTHGTGRVRIKGLGILATVATHPRSGRGINGLPYSTPASRRVHLSPDAALVAMVKAAAAKTAQDQAAADQESADA